MPCSVLHTLTTNLQSIRTKELNSLMRRCCNPVDLNYGGGIWGKLECREDFVRRGSRRARWARLDLPVGVLFYWERELRNVRPCTPVGFIVEPIVDEVWRDEPPLPVLRGWLMKLVRPLIQRHLSGFCLPTGGTPLLGRG